MKNILEISTYNIEGVRKALELGVDRLELCDNICEGGTTPSYGFTKMAVNTGHKNIFIIVRPRGGDFLYSNDEFELMKEDIKIAKTIGVRGIVSGILTSDGKIDKVRTKELVELSKPMSFTFHRAIDMTANYEEAIEDLIEIGVERVLTSGQESTVPNGVEALKNIISKAGNRINILVGSGVNPSNLLDIKEKTGAKEFHMSAVKEVKSEMKFFNDRLSMGNVDTDEYAKLTVDTEKIEGAIKVINTINN